MELTSDRKISGGGGINLKMPPPTVFSVKFQMKMTTFSYLILSVSNAEIGANKHEHE